MNPALTNPAPLLALFGCRGARAAAPQIIQEITKTQNGKSAPDELQSFRDVPCPLKTHPKMSDGDQEIQKETK